MKQREIKFRAYHKKQNRMFSVYGFGIDFITEDTLDGVSPGDNCWQGDELKNIEIMQFTGLKDKNGVDIYEGDIVEYISTTKYDPIGNHCVFKGIIERWCGQMGVGFRYRSGSFTMMLKLSHSFNMSVIGNIHEHKHLLK